MDKNLKQFETKIGKKIDFNNVHDYKDERDDNKNTVYHYLAWLGNYECLKKAIQDYPDIVNYKNKYDIDLITTYVYLLKDIIRDPLEIND